MTHSIHEVSMKMDKEWSNSVHSQRSIQEVICFQLFLKIDFVVRVRWVSFSFYHRMKLLNKFKEFWLTD